MDGIPARVLAKQSWLRSTTPPPPPDHIYLAQGLVS